MNDEFYMERALDLARLTEGQTSPNPMVGCILVKDGRVVGTGTHLRAGGPHAEVFAVQQAGEAVRGATAFVTLEPCAHIGRTPPCAELLVRSGIGRVVVATLDDNPMTAGKGVALLRESGIEVTVGILEKQARELNQAFFFFQREKRPRVTLKASVSLDGKIATRTGESRWITAPEARRDGHHYRHRLDAILVGIGTVLADNPSLTTRLPNGGIQPLRVVLDSRLRVPPDAAVLDGNAPTLVFTSNQADVDKIRILRERGVEIVELGEIVAIPSVLAELARRQILSLLVEGGAAIHGAFLEEGLFEEILLYIAPKLIGGQSSPTAFGGNGIASLASAPTLDIRSVERLGDDLKIVALRRLQPMNQEKF